MNEKYGFFAKMRDSVVKPAIAVYAVDNRGGGAVRYLLKLCLLAAFLMAATLLIQAYPLGGIAGFNAGIPDFDLSGGRLSIDLDEPMIFESGDSVFIIDASSSTDILSRYENFAGRVAFLNSDIFYAKSGFQEYSMPWGDLGFETSSEAVKSAVFKWTWLLIALMCLFFLIFDFIGGLFFALIVSVISMILSAAVGPRLGFGKLFWLSIYAMTAQKLVKMIFSLLNSLSPLEGLYLPGLMCYVITLGFMVIYLMALKKRADEGQLDGASDVPYGNYTAQQDPGSNGQNPNDRSDY